MSIQSDKHKTNQQKAAGVSDFKVVGKVSDFEDNQGQAFEVAGRMVAVFRKGDEWYAIDDLCPHMGASLAEGHVEENSVTCPWHAWRFCIKDGTWEDNPSIKVDSFEVKVEDDHVMVKPIE
ncbi:Assimilatory nitrite reductase [NAD(P)H] small subunit [Rubripirellula obstinata]|uniref:Assimilatory nitrite reductase [NAD(P)H] small subunit n=1 Tax=Rubripirellula obstinata TaxID=406547 RepID=A0A5B1CKH0_9BACT|nr:Assimilatory nitrite reductase [NAD(P)H] small subunit [Rubripirellula obstinata]